MNDRQGSPCIRASDAPKPPKRGCEYWIGIFKPNSYNIETHVSRPRFERFWRNLARWHSSTLVTRPPSWKIQKHHISAAVTAISTKFGMMTQFVSLDPSTFKNLKFRESKMATAAISDFRKISISRPRFMRFRQNWHDDAVRLSWPVWLFGSIWHNNAVWCSWPFWPLRIWNFENQDGGGRHLEKLKSIYRLATGNSHVIWDHTVLHATRQWWESCLCLYVEATWWMQCWRGLPTTNFSYKSYMSL